MSLPRNFTTASRAVGLHCHAVNYNETNYKSKWFVFENNVWIFACHSDEAPQGYQQQKTIRFSISLANFPPSFQVLYSWNSSKTSTGDVNFSL